MWGLDTNSPYTSGGFSPVLTVKYSVTASYNLDGNTCVGKVPFSPGAGEYQVDWGVGSGSSSLSFLHDENLKR